MALLESGKAWFVFLPPRTYARRTRYARRLGPSSCLSRKARNLAETASLWGKTYIKPSRNKNDTVLSPLRRRPAAWGDWRRGSGRGPGAARMAPPARPPSTAPPPGAPGAPAHAGVSGSSQSLQWCIAGLSDQCFSQHAEQIQHGRPNWPHLPDQSLSTSLLQLVVDTWDCRCLCTQKCCMRQVRRRTRNHTPFAEVEKKSRRAGVWGVQVADLDARRPDGGQQPNLGSADELSRRQHRLAGSRCRTRPAECPPLEPLAASGQWPQVCGMKP